MSITPSDAKTDSNPQFWLILLDQLLGQFNTSCKTDVVKDSTYY